VEIIYLGMIAAAFFLAGVLVGRNRVPDNINFKPTTYLNLHIEGGEVQEWRYVDDADWWKEGPPDE